MAGNSIRSVAKFLYDNDIVKKDEMTIETASGIKTVRVFTCEGKVSSATVDIGKAELKPERIPVLMSGENVINRPYTVLDKEYNITCVSTGNPHCVVFVDNVDKVDIETVGRAFENAEIFPERVNTEFVRVVNSNTIKTAKRLRAVPERLRRLLRRLKTDTAKRARTSPLSSAAAI